LELIGAEKAGILRANRPAVLGTPQMPASVYAAISRLGARAMVAERDFSWQIHATGWDYHGLALTLESLPPSALAGAIQYRNAAPASAALEALRASENPRPVVGALATRLGMLDRRAAAAALERVHLPGRFQIIPGKVEWILDIAHNEPAARM